MHFLRRSFAAAAVSLALLSTAAVAAESPGYVDFGSFVPSAGKQFVEVELDGGLLKLAAVFAEKHDAEISKLVANLERVRVNVVGLTDETRADAVQRVEELRQSLSNQGWKRVVTVKEAQGEDVGVFLKQAEDGSIQGAVVTVLEGSNEAVFVNIVGNIRLEQIAAIGERLDLAPLRKLDLAAAK